MKTVKVELLYDSAFQMMNLQAGEEFDYLMTVELDDGVYIDFDTKNIPRAIEVFDPSKRMRLRWNLFIGARYDIELKVKRNVISFRMKVTIKNSNIEPRVIELEVPNDYRIPPGEYSFPVNEIPI